MQRLAIVLMSGALGLAGCGGGDDSNSVFESEVQGAMEMIGNFVDTRAALTKADRLNREAQRCLAIADADCAEAAIDELDQLQGRIDRLQRNTDFSRYSRRVYNMAMRRVQARGLIGEGCSQTATGWKC